MPRTLAPHPLDGAIVVLTRRHEDNVALARELRQSGAEVVELPCVRTERLEGTGELARVVARLGPEDLLVLASRAGAEAVGEVRPREGIPCGIAAVGDATARRAATLGMRVQFVASHADARTLGHELPLPRGEVVLARADLADGDLPAILRRRGAHVREVVAYRTVAGAQGDPAPVRRALERADVTVVVASPSAVDALVAVVGATLLRRASFVAIGHRTAERVAVSVEKTAIVAEHTDAPALARAVESVYREEMTR